jgi:hypothetical protein
MTARTRSSFMTKSKTDDETHQICDGQDYCGSIFKTDDGFLLFDCDGNPVDTFKTLSEAMENAGGPRSEFDYWGD